MLDAMRTLPRTRTTERTIIGRYACSILFCIATVGCDGPEIPDAGADAVVDAGTDVSNDAEMSIDASDAAASDAGPSDVPGAPDASGPCSPQDATAVGMCAGQLGFAWNGVACVQLIGCSCSGTACGSLPTTLSGCQSAHLSCPGIDCRTTGCPSGMNCQACSTPMDQAYTCLPNGSSC